MLGKGRVSMAGERIVLHFGELEVIGVLEENVAARALAKHLPFTLRMQGAGIDYCGSLPFSLPYDRADVHCGWVDGDINYCPSGSWFAVLFDDERNSQRYGDQLTIGHVEGALDGLRQLSGSFDVLVDSLQKVDEQEES